MQARKSRDWSGNDKCKVPNAGASDISSYKELVRNTLLLYHWHRYDIGTLAVTSRCGVDGHICPRKR
jgi:hypothetical protein